MSHVKPQRGVHALSRIEIKRLNFCMLVIKYAPSFIFAVISIYKSVF